MKGVCERWGGSGEAGWRSASLERMGAPGGDRSEKSFLLSALQRGRGYLPQVGFLAQGSVLRL